MSLYVRGVIVVPVLYQQCDDFMCECTTNVQALHRAPVCKSLRACQHKRRQ